jgi:hypothetical protein
MVVRLIGGGTKLDPYPGGSILVDQRAKETKDLALISRDTVEQRAIGVGKVCGPPARHQ